MQTCFCSSVPFILAQLVYLVPFLNNSTTASVCSLNFSFHFYFLFRLRQQWNALTSLENWWFHSSRHLIRSLYNPSYFLLNLIANTFCSLLRQQWLQQRTKLRESRSQDVKECTRSKNFYWESGALQNWSWARIPGSPNISACTSTYIMIKWEWRNLIHFLRESIFASWCWMALGTCGLY